jgi:NTE family protein
MPIDLLSTAPGLDPTTLQDLEALAAGAEPRMLRRGEVLVRQGDASDDLHLVLSGRFGVYVDGAAEPLAEIGQGQTVGEIGFFSGLPRTATVLALRDSSVLTLTRRRFREISDTSPGVRDAVIVSLARRLAEIRTRPAQAANAVRTLAVLPAGASGAPAAFLEHLRAVFGARSRAVFLTRETMAERFPDAALDDAEPAHWINALESENDYVLYVAEQALTDWTQKCIRQADVVLLVAAAGASPDLNASERLAFALHARAARRLVIVHPARSDIASGTSAWLAERDVAMHHHVAVQDAADVRRLFRFLSGRALGFVAGGGGALGSAHLGVYKAFCEAGAEFDILGGTSVGAAMMAAFAYGVDAERVDAGTGNIFVTSRVFRRLTLPRYGLIDHKVFDRALRAEFGDTLIEDLWRPYFAVSSNLSRHAPMIHRRGRVWQAVRASSSIPGVLPPFFTREGEMLVDGALMDNVPLAPMKALKDGPNVVVMLGADDPTTYQVEYDLIPGPRELAATMLNPFARRQTPEIPGVLQVIMLSMLANRRPDLPLGDADVLIRPEVPVDLRFTSWERHTEVFQDAYRKTAPWIEARAKEGDPRLQEVIGAAR